MFEMPLQFIVTFGRMAENQLDDLLRMLNADVHTIAALESVNDAAGIASFLCLAML